MKFDRIFLKFEKLPSNYITKLSTYVRQKYEIFENFGAMLLCMYGILTWHRKNDVSPEINKCEVVLFKFSILLTHNGTSIFRNTTYNELV